MVAALSFKSDSVSFPHFAAPPDSDTIFLTLHPNPPPDSDKQTPPTSPSRLAAGESCVETSEKKSPLSKMAESQENWSVVVVTSEEKTASFKLEVRITDTDCNATVETLEEMLAPSDGNHVINKSSTNHGSAVATLEKKSATPSAGFRFVIKNSSRSSSMKPRDATLPTTDQTSVSFLADEADRPMAESNNLEARKSPQEKRDGVSGGSQEFDMLSWPITKPRSAGRMPVRAPSTRVRRTTIPSEGSKLTKTKEQKQGFSILLSKEAIAADMFAMTGKRKPCSRPKRRTTVVQNILDNLFPGMCLQPVKPNSSSKKRRR